LEDEILNKISIVIAIHGQFILGMPEKKTLGILDGIFSDTAQAGLYQK